jgi:drug/metabolite transporter (DMT)-like permease
MGDGLKARGGDEYQPNNKKSQVSEAMELRAAKERRAVVGRRFAIGLRAALTSSLFLGLAPVFGKLAIRLGLPPLFVVATRTILAALLLLVFILIWKRQFLFIYPAGLLGCILAGWLNGMGSLLYYSALGRLDASLGQVIYSVYPLFVTLWLWLDRQRPSRLTVMRLFMIFPALILLTAGNHHAIDYPGVFMMLGASALYALHLPVNQRVLFDMPAPTVTMYTLIGMSATVLPALFFVNFKTTPAVNSWLALLGVTIVTFFARLTLFMGVKHLGGLQTALLGLGELLVTLFFSHIILDERLNIYQWAGVILLIVSLALVKFEKAPKQWQSSGGWLSWLRPPGLPPDLP